MSKWKNRILRFLNNTILSLWAVTYIAPLAFCQSDHGFQIEEFPNGTALVNAHFWIYFCNDDQKKIIYDTMDDAKRMLELTKTPNLDEYAAQEYLGAQWRDEWESYNDKIFKVFQAAYDLSNTWYLFYGPYVYCQNEQYQCSHDDKDGGPIVVSYPDGNYANDAQLTLVLCDRWFKQNSLEAAIKQGKFCRSDDPVLYSKVYNNIIWYSNRAFWLVLAIFYIREVNGAMTVQFNPRFGPNPPPPPPLCHYWPGVDYVWRDRQDAVNGIPVMTPFTAKRLATNKAHEQYLSSGALGSPTNYALYVLAVYLTREMEEYPDLPYHWRSENEWYPPPDQEMCFDSLRIAKDSYVLNQTVMAVAPWVFTPEGRSVNLPATPQSFDKF
ncbi:hypothetical protein H072_2253 [Dactylellina haptotyla CBS 200.50]|uniref:Uncharacterized protein n=1 Tax=Dactylellina haptotyla (strain CBS 200.50) TaxID=1284197 RepID=S8ALG3_DACHA|nr:hypothetical protein H072_2253 [Dactylellina haptotyla CBS 200.50]